MKTIELHVGRGHRRGPLTVFPIWQERSEGRAVVLGDDRIHSGRARSDSQHYRAVRRAGAVGRGEESCGRSTAGDHVRPRRIDQQEVWRRVQMHLHLQFGATGGHPVQSRIGQFELRGISDGDRLLHASVINHQAAAV
jgi:hypothetical protein